MFPAVTVFHLHNILCEYLSFFLSQSRSRSFYFSVFLFVSHSSVFLLLSISFFYSYCVCGCSLLLLQFFMYTSILEVSLFFYFSGARSTIFYINCSFETQVPDQDWPSCIRLCPRSSKKASRCIYPAFVTCIFQFLSYIDHLVIVFPLQTFTMW
jgi:hypothetical protein